MPKPSPMPKPDAFLKICPSRAVMARIGEKWTLLVMACLADGPVRFGALRRRIEGISQKMLTQVLRHLERDGLIERRCSSSEPQVQVLHALPIPSSLGRAPSATG
jgi:DNA-binding HxlR family transcriptional regulator